MDPPPRAERALSDERVSVRAKLSACWVTVALLFGYVDILGFYKPGVVKDILAGKVSDFDITQAWALAAFTIVTPPIVMVALSLTLPPALARWSNLVLAVLYIPVSATNLIDGGWLFMYVGAAVEIAVLLAIIRIAWRWPGARPSA
jgi:hypothetical protein